MHIYIYKTVSQRKEAMCIFSQMTCILLIAQCTISINEIHQQLYL